MLSPRHHLIGLLAITLGGFWIAPTAVAQVDSCPSFPSSPSSLSGSDNPNLENFGFSLAIEGETLAVGAPGHGAMESRDSPSGQTHNIGRVYLFTREGTEWQQQGVYCPTSDDDEIQFGRAVALGGDVLAVGAPEENVGGQEAAGRVYLFKRGAGGNCSNLVAPLTLTAGAANVPEGAKFGFSLGLDGDLLVVGAPFYPTQGRFAGAVFVFRRSENTWVLEAGPLVAEDTAPFDAFGTAVAVSDGRFVVGAPLHDEASERGNSGAAYQFEPDGQGGWVDRKILPGEGPAEDDLYGFAVAMDGNTVVVGARAGDTDRGADTGAAFVFTCGSSGCAEQVQLTACDGQPGDELGAAVAVQEDRRIDDGDLVVVGARRNDDGNEDPDRDSGAAYIYRLIDGTWTLEARVAADSPGPSDQAFGRAVAVAGPHVVAGESLSESLPGEKNAGSAHVFTAQADLGVTEPTVEAPPVPGTTIPHRVTFRNGGPSPAIGAELEVVFARGDPASATGPLLSGLTGECQCQNEQCTEVKGLPPDARSRRFTALVDLFPGGEVSCEVRPRVAPDARGDLIATAEIQPPPTVEEPQSEELPNSQEKKSTLQPRADLVLQPTATPGFGVPGGNPNIYQFTVTNKGPSDVLPGEALVTADFMVKPANITLPVDWRCRAVQGSCGPGSGEDVSDPIALQVDGTLTYEVRVSAGPSDRGRIEGVLKVEPMGDLEDTNQTNNERTVETRLEPRADLLVTLAGPETAVPGDAASVYTLAVANQGPSAVLFADGVEVQTTAESELAEEIAWTCMPPGRCSPEGDGDIRDTIGLEVNEQITYTLEISYLPEARGEATTTASVLALDPVRFRVGTANGSESAITTLLTPEADLAVAFEDRPGTAVPGARDPVTFSFRVTNADGPSAVLAGEAEVEASFGEELTLIRCTVADEDGGNTCDPKPLCRFPADTPDHGCTLNDKGIRLNRGGVLIYTVEALARPVLSPRVENEAVVRVLGPLREPESAMAPNEAQALTTLTPVNLALSKSLDSEGMGDRVYCLQVDNQSNDIAEGIRLFDPTPPGLDLMKIEGGCPDCTVSADLSCSPCTDVDLMVPDRETGCFPCQLDPLAPEEQACLQVRFMLGADDSENDPAGSVDPVNRASLAAATADPGSANNSADTSMGSGAEESESTPALSLTLVDAPIRIDNGENLIFELDVNNPDSVDTSTLQLGLKLITEELVTIEGSEAALCEAQEDPPCEMTVNLTCVTPEESPCPSWSLAALNSKKRARIQLILSKVDQTTEIVQQRFLRSDFVVVTADTPDDEAPVSNAVTVLTGIGDREPADLVLEAEFPEGSPPDESLPVTLILRNNGPGPATGVRLEAEPRNAVIVRKDASGLCNTDPFSVPPDKANDSFLCLVTDPDTLVPGSVVLLPVTLEPGFETVTFRVTTNSPDPHDNNLVEVSETTKDSLASPRPTSLVPRRLGTSGPP